jgi:hypothetical protein
MNGRYLIANASLNVPPHDFGHNGAIACPQLQKPGFVEEAEPLILASPAAFGRQHFLAR